MRSDLLFEIGINCYYLLIWILFVVNVVYQILDSKPFIVTLFI